MFCYLATGERTFSRLGLLATHAVAVARGRRPILISLSGLDGAGKSTLAEALRADLEKQGLPVVVLHMNKDVGLYAYARTMRDFVKSLGGKSARPSGERDSAPRAPPSSTSLLLKFQRSIVWHKGLRRWVDVADLLLFLAYRFYVERLRGRVLIMDRYFYDRLADLADGKRWKHLRRFSRIVPVPDLAVFVEVSPEEAFARKGEYSVESMTARRAAYREIFSWMPEAVVVDNDNLKRALDELRLLLHGRGKRARRELVVVE